MPDVSTPRSLGYYWPAEWVPHAATWLAWPHNRESWPGKFAPVPEQFAAFVRTLAEFEPVNILAGRPEVMAEAKALVGNVTNVTLHDIPTNDAWCRDHGPTFLAGPQGSPPALVDWQYNAWGGKYPPFDFDNAVPGKIAALQQRRLFAPGIILEGGAIENNGHGVLLTTERCLLNPNRNPQLDRQQTEQYLRDYLSVDKILWLKEGDIPGDDTDGHIDQLARFVNPTTIVAAVAADENDECFASLQAMWAELTALTDQDDLPFTIVPLPIPQPKFVGEQRLPCSYCNFIIANGAVIVPQFQDPADAVALATLARLFPDRQVRGCNSLDLIWGLGSFHCMSQQEPLSHQPEA
ncbi:MAG TPA: agmatine deiminase family protein [Pirellulaceae bacterium]|nr:agmatine deiminase family protein [Pirellulaceae bacterium]